MDCVIYSRRVEPLVPEQRVSHEFQGATHWGKNAHAAKAAMTSSSDEEEDDCPTVDHPCIQPNQVMPGLYLASAYTEGVLGVLEKYGITHVLQVGVPGVEVFPHHLGLIEYGNIHLIDSADADLVPHLPSAITWLDGCLHSGSKVLVHCVHGQSRSPAVVIAYLMWRNDWDFPTALDAVRATRPRAAPNPGFEYQLRLLHQASFDTASWPGWDSDALAACQLQASAAAAHAPPGAPWQLHHPFQEAGQWQQAAQPVEQEQGQQQQQGHPEVHLQQAQEEQPEEQQQLLLHQDTHMRHRAPAAAAGLGSGGTPIGSKPPPGAGAGRQPGCGRMASCCIM